jgi:signal peptidase I
LSGRTSLNTDRIFIEKITQGFNRLERGDIIVFTPPEQAGLKDDLIKRLVGLPGDTVEIKDGKLFVNDQIVDEPYLAELMEYTFHKVTVPAGKIFVLGDNRNRSYDSHEWGFADLDSIKGKAFLTYWPLNRMRYC